MRLHHEVEFGVNERRVKWPRGQNKMQDCRLLLCVNCEWVCGKWKWVCVCVCGGGEGSGEVGGDVGCVKCGLDITQCLE